MRAKVSRIAADCGSSRGGQDITVRHRARFDRNSQVTMTVRKSTLGKRFSLSSMIGGAFASMTQEQIRAETLHRAPLPAARYNC